MADLVHRRPRSAPIIDSGSLALDPALGALTTPPSFPYTGNLALVIGKHHIVMTRDEFLAHAKRCADIVTLING